jgi:hypothetical protein
MKPAALLLLLLAVAPCRAQHDLARYSAFVEILGNTGVASLNFDTANDAGVGVRIGGFISPDLLFACLDDSPECRSRREAQEVIDREPGTAVYLVAMGHRLIGDSAHKLELGLGVLVGRAAPGVLDGLPRAALTATVGYRLQPEVRGLGFRAGLAPIVAPERVLLRPGFSLSYGLPTPR